MLARRRHADRYCGRIGARRNSIRACLRGHGRFPQDEVEPYFRTQITRTTDVFGSEDALATLTPLALRNSSTTSAGISAACAASVAFGGPATTTGFNSAMPANLPSASSAAAPEKPTAGAGESASSPPLPTCATEDLMLLAAAAPPWFCGSAMPVSSRLAFAAPLLKPSGFNPRAP